MLQQLIINQQKFDLTVQPNSCESYCFRCQLKKSIWLTSERQVYIGTTQTWQARKFCWGCALYDFYKLEHGDYQIENKKEVIRELRRALIVGEQSEVELEPLSPN